MDDLAVRLITTKKLIGTIGQNRDRAFYVRLKSGWMAVFAQGESTIRGELSLDPPMSVLFTS